MQRWLSGLRRTIGNRVTANTRPEVQIFFSAPDGEGRGNPALFILTVKIFDIVKFLM